MKKDSRRQLEDDCLSIGSKTTGGGNRSSQKSLMVAPWHLRKTNGDEEDEGEGIG